MGVYSDVGISSHCRRQHSLGIALSYLCRWQQFLGMALSCMRVEKMRLVKEEHGCVHSFLPARDYGGDPTPVSSAFLDFSTGMDCDLEA